MNFPGMKSRLDYYRRLARIFWSYKKRKTRLSYLPIRLWIEPASICNLRCVMCPNKSLEKAQKGHMDLSLFKKIIDEAAGFVFDVNLHHRGESLLHPEFFRMVAYARAAGLVTRFHTNGTLLDEEKSKEMIASGLDQLTFSVDGFDAETYERIRVNADFEKTMENIVRFLEIKKSTGGRKPKTIIELIDQPGLGESAARSRKAFEDRFRGLPLDRIYVKEIHNWAGEMGAVRRKKSFTPCAFLWNALIVFWDGTVLPCTQDFFGYYPLGNVRDSSLAAIWNNERMVGLREKIVRGDIAEITTCSRCDRLWRNQIFGIPKDYLGRFLLKRME